MRQSTSFEQSWDVALDEFESQRANGAVPITSFGDPEIAYERREFLEKNPWRVFALQVEQRISRERTERKLRWTSWLAGLGFALSAAVAAVVLYQPTPAEPSEAVRRKGGISEQMVVAPSGRLVLRTAGKQVTSGAVIAPGSELRFSVNTVGYDHVFIAGRDEDGSLSPYYPESWRQSSVLVGVGRGLQLPDSVLLDDIMGKECMIALFSTTPLQGAHVQSIMEGSKSSAEGILMERICFIKRP